MEKSKIMIVTGASSGIGNACAKYFHQNKWTVYGLSRTLDKNSEFISKHIDVSDNESVTKCIQEIYYKEKRIDVVINCAGISNFGTIEDMTIEQCKDEFETNFFGTVRICKEIIPIMRKQKYGYILNFSSYSGLAALPFIGIYSSSKFAIEGFSEALSLEVSSFGIKVVLIEPGTFKTNMTSNCGMIIGAVGKKYYSNVIGKFLAMNNETEKKAKDVFLVAKLIDKIIKKKKPRFRYKIGIFSETLFLIIKKTIPFRTFEKLVLKKIGLI